MSIAKTGRYRREIDKRRIGDGYTYTLDDGGRIFKVTRERVRPIEAKAVRNLQHRVRNRQIEAFLDGLRYEVGAPNRRPRPGRRFARPREDVMAGPASIFREIHRLRRFIRDAQDQVDRIPRQRKAYQAKLAKVEQTQKDEQEAVKKLKVTGSDREKTLKSTEEQIKRYQTQLESASSKKIADALTLEIAAARERCGKLEDEILGAITEGEERQARLPEMDKAVGTVRADLARYDADIAPRKQMLDSQLQEAQGQLVEIEKQIPDDLQPQYKRTVASQGADGFALVQNDTCTGCNTEIIRQVRLDLSRGLFLMCNSCGRILYTPAATPLADEEDA